jgi:cob(I)alamin adenosyltransferase
MKVYTRGGDTGETSLFGGVRVSKDAARVEAYGAIDELNALLGVVRGDLEEGDLDEQLTLIQSSLFDLGSELATPDAEGSRTAQVARVSETRVGELEGWIDRLEEELEPLRTFILPAGSRGAAGLHHARTVCRRAERRTVTLAAEVPLRGEVVRYLNRLSDLLFVMARVANHRAGVTEEPWVGRER